ncbi:MAG: sugar ABC transporter substrate-binding protein [Actinomycetota bacterium]|nr:sugar ABC transporter substrate-binding protein [Actinomycetota bacterium]
MSSPGRRPGHLRTITCCAVVAVSVLGLAACSSSSKSTAAGPAGSAGGSCATANKKLNMGIVYADSTQNPFQEMALGAQAAAKEDGNVKLTSSAPSGVNNSQEVSLFQSVARQATDGVAYESIAPDLFTRALKDATGNGTPVVAVDAPPPAGSGVNTFVANSNTLLGELLGQAFVASKPDPTGTVVLGNDIPSLTLLGLRLNGVQSVLKAKLPQMKIVGPLNSGSTTNDNYTLWKSIVNSHSGAVGYLGVGGQDGVSLPLIEKQTGANFLVGSADIPPEALQSVKDGKIFALSSPEHWMKGYIAMYLLIHAKRTCTAIPQGWWNSGNLLIDKSNIDAIIARQVSPDSRTAFFKPEIAKQLASPPIQPISSAN